METYPEQFPGESQPDPSYRSEDRVFDAIQDSDGPGSTNHEGHQDPGAPEMDSPYAYGAWAALACRSRISGSH